MRAAARVTIVYVSIYCLEWPPPRSSLMAWTVDANEMNPSDYAITERPVNRDRLVNESPMEPIHVIWYLRERKG